MTLHSRATLAWWACIAVAALALASSAGALAAGSSIALKGPHKNPYGTPFHYTAAGSTRGSANYVYAWEVPYSPTCASSYKSQSHRSGKARFVHKSLSKNKRFSFVIELFARIVGSHRFCVYVINKASGKTFAHAETTWTNYAAPVPSPVGSSECHAKRFPDESVYAQVALSDVSCELLESVAYAADAAKGSAYDAAGFTCTPTAEGAGSKWAAAWTGTYYAYGCVSGSKLAAFNWGPHYAYAPVSTLPMVKSGG